MAASQMYNSSKVAFSSWRKQATTCARDAASKFEAGPLRTSSAASEPLVRWRRLSLCTNNSDTLNCAATSPVMRPAWLQAAATRSRKSVE